jgi:hypothetical protein
MIKIKNHLDYFNTVDLSKLEFIEDWRVKKEHIKNTFNLYFENFIENQILTQDEIELLEDWFLDVAKEHKELYQGNLPYNKKIKTEAIKYDNKLILKECFNLLHLIYKYHRAYILRNEYDNEIEDTIYKISSDKRALTNKYKKFDKISKNKRYDRKYRAKFYLLKKVLNILIKDEYTKRIKQYFFFISLNFRAINWSKVLDTEENNVKETFFESLRFFMYFNLSEIKIKNSLMILVYTFLTKRLQLNEINALNLTNRLSQNILYDLDSRNDYLKREVSKNIYLYGVFDFLPIFLHYNEKDNAPYTEEEKEKLINSIKKQAVIADKKFNKLDNSIFIDSFENSHIHYIKQELIFLYNEKNE